MANASLHSSWRVGARQYAVCFCFQMSLFAIGAMTSYTAPAIPDMKSADNKFTVSRKQGALIGSILFVGAVIGSIIVAPAIRLYGQKTVVISSHVVFTFGWLLILSANSVLPIYFGRICTGITFGICVVAPALYSSEVAKPEVRGRIMSIGHLMTSLGGFSIMCLALVLHWRWLAVSIQVMSLLAMISITFAPDSPRWCLSKGRVEEGTDVLQWLRGEKADITDEINAIKKNIEKRKAAGGLSWKMLSDRSFTIPLALIEAIVLLQQFTGVSVITLNLTEVLGETSSKLDPNLQSVIVHLTEISAAIPLMMLVDRLGRRIMLMTSFLICAVVLVALGAIVLLNVHYPQKMTTTYYWLPIVCICIFRFGIFLGNQIPFMLMVELHPACMKEFACSANIVLYFATNIIVPSIYVFIISAVGYYGMFWIFAGFATIGVIFVYLVVPETKKMSLEQIQTMTAANYQIPNNTVPYVGTFRILNCE